MGTYLKYIYCTSFMPASCQLSIRRKGQTPLKNLPQYAKQNLGKPNNYFIMKLAFCTLILHHFSEVVISSKQFFKELHFSVSLESTNNLQSIRVLEYLK